jgi:hypothetical protein
LRVADYSSGIESFFYFKATTPNLETYIDDGIRSVLNTVEVDTNGVTFLNVLHAPDCFHYPLIVDLCFSGITGQEKEAAEVIEYLRDNPTPCPDLTLIRHRVEFNPEQH